MSSKQERFQTMEQYFGQYIQFLNKHEYVKTACKSGGPEKIGQKGDFKGATPNVYVQNVSVKLLPRAPTNTEKLKQTLELDVGGAMQGHFQGGSRLMSIEEKPDDTFVIQLFYAPEKPVFDDDSPQKKENLQ